MTDRGISPVAAAAPGAAMNTTAISAAAAAATSQHGSGHHPTGANAGPALDDGAAAIKKPQKRKKAKRKAVDAADSAADADVEAAISRKTKKKKRNKEKEGKLNDEMAKKKARKKPPKSVVAQEGLSAAQIAVNEQMSRILQEDKYSANGSIVETDSEEEETVTYRNETVRMDRAALSAAMRKHLWMGRLNSSGSGNVVSPQAGGGGGDDGDDDDDNRRGGRKKKKNKKSKDKDSSNNTNNNNNMIDDDEEPVPTSRTPDAMVNTDVTAPDAADDYDDRDGGSIFGQPAGASNATWVECDKCKKWRRLRGVVDAKKLPSRWYCSMNKNDPERARCSAPEEEYETPHTPESAADARTRKHLMVWVRRLQCNEAYESRQPTLTRGRKKATASSAKEPYEWVRCCNQSCGKWRAILRMMDAKGSVVDRTSDGEWYCVMNMWDEKMASCAAPQENLPAIGCPPWVNQDEK